MKIVLELNEKEARWLKGAMKNPLDMKSPGEEPSEDLAIRRNIFESLRAKLNG
jgi:hypothetical protein